MKFIFRRHRRRQDKDSFIKQFKGFIGCRHTTNIARRRFVIMDATHLFRKAFADVLCLARHAHQRLMQMRYSGRSRLRHGIFRIHQVACAALDMRRRWHLRNRRGLTLRAMHQVPLTLAAKRLARSKPAFETVPVVAKNIENYHVVPGTGLEPVWLAPRDFKSLVSTNFTIRARG